MAEERKIAPFRSIPKYVPRVMPEGAIPCTHAGYHKSVTQPILDPYNLDKWEKEQRKKYPSRYR